MGSPVLIRVLARTRTIPMSTTYVKTLQYNVAKETLKHVKLKRLRAPVSFVTFPSRFSRVSNMMGDKMDTTNTSLTSTEREKAIESLVPRSNVTEEEFQNFMHRVGEVERIVKKLASTKLEDQEYGKLLADEILKKSSRTDVSENAELMIKTDRTLINKRSSAAEETDPSNVSREAFMRSIESDAKQRAEDRKIRNERAETHKRIGNSAFRRGDFEKAITYYTKGLEQRKDSSVLWNNRALAYMQLGLYEKALPDCEWALKIDKSNLKALLNSAKCHALLGNVDKCEEFIDMAKEENPNYIKYIEEFLENLRSEQPEGINSIL